VTGRMAQGRAALGQGRAGGGPGVRRRGRVGEGEDVGDPLGDEAGSTGSGRRAAARSATGGSIGQVGGGEARNQWTG
jgi:hypothetical protein